MNFTTIQRSAWLDLLKGNIEPELESFALRVLLTRLILQNKLHPDEETATRSFKELEGFFEKNANLPSLQKDLQSIADCVNRKLPK